MSEKLNQLLMNLMVLCSAKAVREPSAKDPVPKAWEDEADEFCRRFARTKQVDHLSPEAASAMIPRIACAFAAGSPTEASCIQASSFGDAAATPERMLEELLIDSWHKILKPRWLDGRIVLRETS